MNLKTVWKGSTPKAWAFICPICRIHRRVPISANPRLKHYFQIFLVAAFFTLIGWKVFKWKGLFSFIPFWIVFETIYRWNARAILYCKQCGFDPYLFMVNTEAAKQEVAAHWRKKLEAKGLSYPDGKVLAPKLAQPTPQKNSAN
jgi:hypothetical protein